MPKPRWSIPRFLIMIFSVLNYPILLREFPGLSRERQLRPFGSLTWVAAEPLLEVGLHSFRNDLATADMDDSLPSQALKKLILECLIDDQGCTEIWPEILTELNAGADLNALGNSGEALLPSLAYIGRADLIDYVIDHYKGQAQYDLLILTAAIAQYKGERQVLKVLARHGVAEAAEFNRSAATRTIQVILNIAGRLGEINNFYVKTLIPYLLSSHHGDVNVQSHHGYTIAHYAVQKDYEAWFADVLKYKPNLFIENNIGGSPIITAFYSNLNIEKIYQTYRDEWLELLFRRDSRSHFPMDQAITSEQAYELLSNMQSMNMINLIELVNKEDLMADVFVFYKDERLLSLLAPTGKSLDELRVDQAYQKAMLRILTAAISFNKQKVIEAILTGENPVAKSIDLNFIDPGHLSIINNVLDAIGDTQNWPLLKKVLSRTDVHDWLKTYVPVKNENNKPITLWSYFYSRGMPESILAKLYGMSAIKRSDFGNELIDRILQNKQNQVEQKAANTSLLSDYETGHSLSELFWGLLVTLLLFATSFWYLVKAKPGLEPQAQIRGKTKPLRRRSLPSIPLRAMEPISVDVAAVLDEKLNIICMIAEDARKPPILRLHEIEQALQRIERPDIVPEKIATIEKFLAQNINELRNYITKTMAVMHNKIAVALSQRHSNLSIWLDSVEVLRSEITDQAHALGCEVSELYQLLAPLDEHVIEIKYNLDKQSNIMQRVSALYALAADHSKAPVIRLEEMHAQYEALLHEAETLSLALAKVHECHANTIAPLQNSIAGTINNIELRIHKVLSKASEEEFPFEERHAKLSAFQDKIETEMQALGLSSFAQTAYLVNIVARLAELQTQIAQKQSIIDTCEAISKTLNDPLQGKLEKRLKLACHHYHEIATLLPLWRSHRETSAVLAEAEASLAKAKAEANTKTHEITVIVPGTLAIDYLSLQRSADCNAYIAEQAPELRKALLSLRYISQQISAHYKLAHKEGNEVYREQFEPFAMHYLLLRLFSLLELREAKQLRNLLAHNYAEVLADKACLLDTALALINDNELIKLTKDHASLSAKLSNLPIYQKYCAKSKLSYYFDARPLSERISSIRLALDKLQAFIKQCDEKGVNNTGSVSTLMTDAARDAVFLLGETLRSNQVPEHFSVVKKSKEFKQAEATKAILRATLQATLGEGGWAEFEIQAAMHEILEHRNNGGHFVLNADEMGVQEAITPHQLYDLRHYMDALEKFHLKLSSAPAEPTQIARSGLNPHAPEFLPTSAVGAGFALY